MKLEILELEKEIYNMSNQEMLITSNKSKITKIFRNNKNLAVKNSTYIVKVVGDIIDGNVIKKLIDNINCMTIKLPVKIVLDSFKFMDKLTYVLFECICNILICRGQSVQIQVMKKINILKQNAIHTQGIEFSPLITLINNKFNTAEFKKSFRNKIGIRNYRKVIIGGKNEKLEDISKVSGDIYFVLKNLRIPDKTADEITEVVGELIGNAIEHSKSDCLFDLDVTEAYKKENSEHNFFGINIVIINFSEQLLGDKIKWKIKNNNYGLSRYETLLDAYNNHKPKFNEQYTEEDFFNIASFQDKITGRLKKENTGGQGLTKLIASLESMSDSHFCYVLSGNREIFFKDHKYLKYNKNGWIGFNKQNDFIKGTPNIEFLVKCPIKIPGTAYNLNFVIEEEK